MRIYMQIQPLDNKPPRFYQLHLQEDLLGGWTLIKEMGYQGSSGKVIQEHHQIYEDAVNALIKTRDQQIQRGYRIVFSEGTQNS
jgi:predicted DNA-binding WGR domain protein